MNLAKRVRKLERIQFPKSPRRYVVRFEDPETGVLEPTDEMIDENTQVYVVQLVSAPIRTEAIE